MRALPPVLLLCLACGSLGSAPVAAPPSAPDAPTGAFGVAETLDLPRAVWGEAVKNTVKGLVIAADPAVNLLYLAGSMNPWVSIVDLAKGHPVATMDLGLERADTMVPRLRADPPHRRLWWVGVRDGAVRGFDLDKRQLVVRQSGTPTPSDPYAVRDAVVDPATGWLWVANAGARTVSGLSPDGTRNALVPGLTQPVAAAVDPKGNAIYVVDGLNHFDARVVKYVPSTAAVTEVARLSGPPGGGGQGPRGGGPHLPGGAPSAGGPRLGPPNARRQAPADASVPRRLLVAPDGTLVVADRNLTGLDAATGSVRWQTRLPGMAEALVPAGSRVAALVRAKGGGPESQVMLVEPATGAAVSTVLAGYQARAIVGDAASPRAWVANAGDGSVSEIDATAGRVSRTIDVSTGAEGVVVDPRTGNRFVLDRLGGGEIHVWKPGASTVTSWPARGWAYELAVDEGRRRLISAGNFDTSLMRWDLDSGAALAPVASGAPASTGDAIGDLDYDPSVGVAAMALAESGFVAVFDVAAGTRVWGNANPAWVHDASGGPGNLQVAVDGKNDRLYVVNGSPRELVALALRTGVELGRASLPELDKVAIGGHILNTLFLDRVNGRLFAGPDPVAVPALTPMPRLPDVPRPFWADATTLLGLRADRSGMESLVELDARALTERRAWNLYATTLVRLQPCFDPATRTLYAADLPAGRVTAWRVP